MKLAARIQASLCATYGVDDDPSVKDFIEPTDEGREELVVREEDGQLEVALRLPRRTIEPSRRPSFDELCQVVEGVSHFVYVAERARRELPATQLELELQAEVDKYVLLGGAAHPKSFVPERAARLRERLFARPQYLHDAGTELGDRYRLANDLAARFVERLEHRFARRGRFEHLRATLRRFYSAGQAEKIELARAA